MRYVILTYFRKPDKHMDEAIAVSKRLKPRDLQTANVILDFQLRKIEKCHVPGVEVVKDFEPYRNYLHKHYTKLVEDLESIYGGPPAGAELEQLPESLQEIDQLPAQE